MAKPAKPTTMDALLNELSDLRREVLALGDEVTADYLAHALACLAKRKTEAGAHWLERAVERLNESTGGRFSTLARL